MLHCDTSIIAGLVGRKKLLIFAECYFCFRFFKSFDDFTKYHSLDVGLDMLYVFSVAHYIYEHIHIPFQHCISSKSTMINIGTFSRRLEIAMFQVEYLLNYFE